MNKKILTVIIAAVSFFIYSNTLLNDYNIDDELIIENHVLRESGKSVSYMLGKIFSEPYYKDASGNQYEYRPVVVASFYFEFLIFGQKPFISHLFNTILFAATCVMLILLLNALFRDFQNVLLLSFITALLFAVHPIHTEAVASIKSRDELLSLFFGIISWMCALNFIDKNENMSSTLIYYPAYLIAFAAAIFSKQSAIVFSILIPVSVILFMKPSIGRFTALALPVILFSVIFSPVYLLYKKVFLFIFMTMFLSLLYYTRHEPDMVKNFVQFFKDKKRIRRLSAAFVVVIALIATGYIFINQSEKASQDVRNFKELQLTPALQAPAPALIPIAGRKLNFVETPLIYVDRLSEKLGTALYALGTYAKLMLVPYPLRFYYGYKQIPVTGFGNIVVLVSLIAHLSMVALVAYFFIRKKHLIAAYGLLFYMVSVIPLSNLLTPIAGVVGERLAYTASLGFCIAFSYGLLFFHRGNESDFIRLKSHVSKIFFILILLFSGMTFARNFDWKDRVTLMSRDIKHLDNSSRAHHLYAMHLSRKAMEIQEQNPAESKAMLGNAAIHINKALEVYPRFPYAWHDLAKIYVRLGEKENAIEAYKNSVKNDSLLALPSFELGILLNEAGRLSEAENAYRLAIEKDSFMLKAYTNLSYLLYRQERYSESIAVNQVALKHLPNAYEVYVNIGKTYAKTGNVNSALPYLEKAVSIQRNDQSLLNYIAGLYDSVGDAEKANYYRNLR